MKLAYARINQETNALSPVMTTIADFERTHFLEGDALAHACSKNAYEAEGFAKNAELSGFVQECARLHVDTVPLLSAWAVPSGPLTRACFDELCAKLVAKLRAVAMHVDGVYLCLHGAMGVEGVLDPEAAIVRCVRDVVGKKPVVVTYDLHGNLTRDVVENVEALIAYATNPHRDHRRTGAKAARALVDACDGMTLNMGWRSLPMLLGGGTTIDLFPPLLPIFLRMRALERSGEIVSASLLTCHPWNAHPELGWSVVVVTKNDQAKAERIADELAAKAWSTRNALPPVFATPHDAITDARRARIRRKLGCVVLADASDVVSAGAPGESTLLLEALVNEGQGLVSYVPLRDPAVVDALWPRNVGDVVEVSLGGKLDPKRNRALTVRATIANKTRSHGVDRTLVLDVKPRASNSVARFGVVRVVVVEGPALAIRPAFFANAGLKPWKADVIVVKNFFPFRMFFLPLARKTVYVRTAGVTDFDAAFALDFAGKVHPRDVVDDWRDADTRRRAPFAA